MTTSDRSIPGFGRLIDDYDGTPAALRWLSIHPDGRVVERVSDNRIGWSIEHEMWVQWRLVRDVYREVDPDGHGYSLAVAVLIRTAHGVAITARDSTGPINPVATGMLAALGVSTRHTARWCGWPRRIPRRGCMVTWTINSAPR